MTGPTGALAESVCFFSCAAVCEKSCCCAVTVLLSRRRSSSSSSSTALLLGVHMALLGVQLQLLGVQIELLGVHLELLGVHIAKNTRSIWLQLHHVTGWLKISSYRSFIPKTTFSYRWYRLHCSLCLVRGRTVFLLQRQWKIVAPSIFLLPVLLLQTCGVSRCFCSPLPGGGCLFTGSWSQHFDLRTLRGLGQRQGWIKEGNIGLTIREPLAPGLLNHRWFWSKF